MSASEQVLEPIVPATISNDKSDDIEVLEPVAAATTDETPYDEAPEDPQSPRASPVPEGHDELDDRGESVPLPEEPFADVTRKLKPDSLSSEEIYVQMKQRFRRLLRSQIKNTENTTESEAFDEVMTLLLQHFRSVMAAVLLQMLLHHATLVIQGLLAGLVIAHSIFAFVFIEPDLFVRGYQWMALPAQATFYFAFAVSTVNAFDRFEPGESFRETVQKFISLQRGGFNALLWTTGTAASVLMAPLDVRLATADLDLETYLPLDPQSLTYYRILSLIRSTCATLGWVFVALQPNTNYTRDLLLRLAGQFSECHNHDSAAKCQQAWEDRGTTSHGHPCPLRLYLFSSDSAPDPGANRQRM
uniref:Bestrophin/UPF0187 n=1 Tax=Panagrellus redivivus TaxID=6233 RepID=A0A7E4VSL9_PANRE